MQSAMKTILIIDDEPKIHRVVRGYLEQAGFRVVVAEDGQAGLIAFRHEKPDLVVLDLMLPVMDGFEVCRRVRRESTVPIIMLTARVDEVDKLLGLESGADDYVVKPFSPRELVARVRAVLRRAEGLTTGESLLRVGGIVIDIEAHEVRVGNRAVDLTPTEFNILAVLARSPGRAFSRSALLEQITDVDYEGFERTVDVHIRNLRTKLETDPKHPRYLTTIYGVGYKLEDCK